MEQNVQLTEIVDKRDPKQQLVVMNSNISNSVFNNCFAANLIFKDISLPHLSVTYADLKHCHFNDINMVNGKISDANLSNLEIEGAQWGGAHIRNVGFSNSSDPERPENPNSVQFTNCNFRNGILTECNLTNVRLDQCKIEGLIINGIQIDKLLELYHSEKMGDKDLPQRE